MDKDLFKKAAQYLKASSPNQLDPLNMAATVGETLANAKQAVIFDKMNELKKALNAGDEDKINALGCELFIKGGQCDWANIKEFENLNQDKQANIFAAEEDSFGWLIGGIRWGEKRYYYG